MPTVQASRWLDSRQLTCGRLPELRRSFLASMGAMMLFEQKLLTGVAATAMPGYALLGLQQVYGGRWGARLLRAALLTGFYVFAVALAFVLLGVALWTLRA